MVPRRSPNGPPMVPPWSPDGPPMVPKWPPNDQKSRPGKKIKNKKSSFGCFRAKPSKRGRGRPKKDFERRSQIKISPYGAEVMTDLRNYVDKTGFSGYVNFLANMVIGQKIWQPDRKIYPARLYFFKFWKCVFSYFRIQNSNHRARDPAHIVGDEELNSPCNFQLLGPSPARAMMQTLPSNFPKYLPHLIIFLYKLI